MASSEQRRFSVVVTGRVQGVGFRYFSKDSAQEQALDGWVRNRADGSVEMQIQGEQARIDRFLEEIGQGPPLAHVSDLRIQEIPVKSENAGFRIAH